ncbi:MAG: anhydro-N-acetylmuramic acid kinase [Chlorobi bacterium]|nr:anhydro-N-acetylmuramic acid kinase [Chlorobiota bacterium]
MENHLVIGLMSGTSLDGLDIALCSFHYQDNNWSFKILDTKTQRYPDYWLNQLASIHNAGAEDLTRLHFEYGHFLGEQVKSFIKRTGQKPDFIASHGHTIFHRPEKEYTLQIGDGNAIAAVTGLPVVFDFRSKDVALGGQGAPLVPIGDKLLFPGYDSCINLGGIANISYESNNQRIAFDICPANQVLNSLSNQLEEPFDNNGEMASEGNLNLELFERLNALGYYESKPPKSLGKEWVDENIYPLLNLFSIPIKDKLRTFTEHIALQITNIINANRGKVLITGGGAYNDFLIERIKASTSCQIEIPNNELIEFKEAMVFAFLGVLRKRNEINCLSSVTGASRNSCSGTLSI